MKTIITFKAFSLDGEHADDLVILFSLKPPGGPMSYIREQYTLVAKEIVDSLLHSAPGGLVDAIFLEMARRNGNDVCLPMREDLQQKAT